MALEYNTMTLPLRTAVTDYVEMMQNGRVAEPRPQKPM